MDSHVLYITTEIADDEGNVEKTTMSFTDIQIIADKRQKWGMESHVLYINTEIADNGGKWGVDNHDLYRYTDDSR